MRPFYYAAGTDAKRYTYDPNGNRLSVTKDTETKGLSYSPQSNRLSAVGNKAVGLDAAGSTALIDNGKWRLTFHAAGGLASVAHGRETEGSYRYNFQGLRTQKTTDKGTIVYHYDLAGQLIAETTPQGYPLRAYVYVDRRPAAQIDWPGNERAHKEQENGKDQGKGKKHDKDKPGKPKEKLVFLHTDHLDTPRTATNPQGTIVWRWEGGAFGETKPEEDPDNNGGETHIYLRFPGQYFDKETGFFYNWHRYYSAKIGRYLSSDPIGVESGLNTYAYAEANPLRYADPLGLWVKRCKRKLGNRENGNADQNSPLRHDYLNVSGSILSFQAGDSMIWSQGWIDDNERTDRMCQMVCDDDKFDNYVFQAANEIGAPAYCVMANPGTLPHLSGARNCQTWANDVLALAKKKYLESEKCPKCFK